MPMNLNNPLPYIIETNPRVVITTGNNTAIDTLTNGESI